MIKLPAGTDLAHLKEIHDLGLSLMEKHGLTGWTLAWGRGTKQAGLCDRGARQITISAKLMALWTIDQARDMLLHEIAHALTTGGHTRQWYNMARSIGSSGSIHWGHLGEASPPPRYTGTCPNGHVSTRERMTKAARRGSSCGKCSPRYDERFKIKWKEA